MTPEIDTEYLAAQLKLIRRHHNLTQANVAELCGLTTRTIENLESGKHRPEHQTLTSLARGLGVEVSVFQKPSPEQQARSRRELEKMIRTTANVRLSVVQTTQEVLASFDVFDGWMVDITSVAGDEALEAAAELAELVTEDGELWGELTAGGQLEIAKGISAACRKLEELGHVCLFGRFRQVQPLEKDKHLVFNVGCVTVRTKKEGASVRLAFVPLKDGWETHPEDRVEMTDV